VHYISTRGYGPATFMDTLFHGLAPDGGLYMPAQYPQFSRDFMDELTYLSYEDIAEKIMSPFVDGEIPQDVFSKMIRQAYKSFDDIEITPLLHYDQDLWVLELFHGPTMAFKDIALQLVGEIMSWALADAEKKVTVIGATSGDTGPAAIDGLKNVENANIFMLFPHNRVSQLQRVQMTTANKENVFPIAIDGTFDDCQALVKQMFNDEIFRGHVRATAVNSLAWPRLMPQMVYYFFAWSRLKEMVGNKPLTFSVPTGNFGNVFAGYLAMQCGLPLNRLLIASNTNDILSRFINEADYSVHGVTATRSPSMDIQIASNFERLLFDIFARKTERVQEVMACLKETGKLPPLTDMEMDEVRSVFAAEGVSEIDTLKMISEADATKNIVLDPHSAVGLSAILKHDELKPAVSLATAHPVKFASAVTEATGKLPLYEDEIDDMMKAEETFEVLPNDIEAVQNYIMDNIV